MKKQAKAVLTAAQYRTLTSAMRLSAATAECEAVGGFPGAPVGVVYPDGANGWSGRLQYVRGNWAGVKQGHRIDEVPLSHVFIHLTF